MCAIVLLAQDLSSSAGIAGWTTFGLAGLILGWLFLKHLPDKDRQLKEILADNRAVVEAKDAQASTLLAVQRDAIAAKDQQVERMLETKNRQIEILTQSGTQQVKTMVESNASQARMMHEENKASLDRVIKHCEDETRHSQEVLGHSLEQLGKAVEELCEEFRGFRQETLSRPIRRQVQRRQDRPGGPMTTNEQPSAEGGD